MTTARLEGFSDGVMAIIITIAALNIHVPADPTFEAFASVLPIFLIYAWSFQIVGTLWGNHHHLMAVTKGVNIWIMWANLHLLFWLSLIPFATGWLGAHIGEAWPTAVYSVISLGAAVAYMLLERAIVAYQGKDAQLVAVLGNNTRELISIIGSILSVIMAFIYPLISYLLAIALAMIWLIPDRRIVPQKNKLT
ncbi:MAG: hypothetical protein JWO07_536 [Candidatus Saccharibacteria bacterium]|nr:hypothetical protein [Candidatus Saccharibacteria bacterium]